MCQVAWTPFWFWITITTQYGRYEFGIPKLITKTHLIKLRHSINTLISQKQDLSLCVNVCVCVCKQPRHVSSPKVSSACAVHSQTFRLVPNSTNMLFVCSRPTCERGSHFIFHSNYNTHELASNYLHFESFFSEADQRWRPPWLRNIPVEWSPFTLFVANFWFLGLIQLFPPMLTKCFFLFIFINFTNYWNVTVIFCFHQACNAKITAKFFFVFFIIAWGNKYIGSGNRFMLYSVAISGRGEGEDWILVQCLK